MDARLRRRRFFEDGCFGRHARCVEHFLPYAAELVSLRVLDINARHPVGDLVEISSTGLRLVVELARIDTRLDTSEAWADVSVGLARGFAKNVKFVAGHRHEGT